MLVLMFYILLLLPLCARRFLMTYFSPSLSLPSILPRPFVEGVTMYSLLVTVLLLASAANESGGQGAWGRVE